MSPEGIGARPENAAAAWVALALEVYRGHDQIFSTPARYDRAYVKALKRLLESLPALRAMIGNVYLAPADRIYVEDLVARIERFCPAPNGDQSRSQSRAQTRNQTRAQSRARGSAAGSPAGYFSSVGTGPAALATKSDVTVSV